MCRVLVLLVLLGACAPPLPERTYHFETTPSPTATASAAAPPAGWRRFAPIPTARSEVAAAVWDGRLIVAGGFGGGRVAEAYDPNGDRWSRLPDLPLSLNHAMATATGEAAYVLGGYLDDGAATARALVMGRDGAWHEGPTMPEPRGAGGAAVIGETLYVVGGARDNRLLPSAYALDRTTNAWRRIADLPTPRDHLAVVAFRGRVCAVGGRRLSLAQNLGALECYDPATDRWEKLPDLPTPRGGLGAAVVADVLYVVGGEQPTGTFKEVELFDGTRWSRAPDLPTPRHGLAVAGIASTLYVIAGGPTPGGSQIAVNEGLVVR